MRAEEQIPERIDRAARDIACLMVPRIIHRTPPPDPAPVFSGRVQQDLFHNELPPDNTGSCALSCVIAALRERARLWPKIDPPKRNLPARRPTPPRVVEQLLPGSSSSLVRLPAIGLRKEANVVALLRMLGVSESEFTARNFWLENSGRLDYILYEAHAAWKARLIEVHPENKPKEDRARFTELSKNINRAWARVKELFAKRAAPVLLPKERVKPERTAKTAVVRSSPRAKPKTKRIKRTCPVCENKFEVFPSQTKQYCSNRCVRLRLNVKVPCACGCGRFEVRTPSDKRRFVSGECYRNWLKRKKAERASPRQCAECSRQFDDIPNGTRKYCSHECSSRARSATIVCACGCGRVKLLSPSRRQRFVSRECYINWVRELKAANVPRGTFPGASSPGAPQRPDLSAGGR